MLRTARYLAVRLLALLPLLCPIGCVSSGSSAGLSADRPGPPTVRIGFFPNVTHAPALLATGDGSLAKAFGDAAQVEEHVFTAGPAEIEALFAREIDLGYIGPGPAVNGFLKSRGKALRIIAGSSSGGTALVARADVKIASIKDLAGKRVAVPQTGGTQDISLRHFLRENGLTPKDRGGQGSSAVEVLQFAPADTLNQFRLKTVDAAFVPEPWVARLEKETGAGIVLDEKTLWSQGRFSTAVVIVRTEFLEQHPELVEKFLTAHIRAVRRIRTEPDAARRVIGERIKELNQGKALPDDILLSALKRTEITDEPLRDSVLTFADWARELGYLRQDRTALGDLFADGPLTAARAAMAADSKTTSARKVKE
ncbi:MAG: aliphatic sulfonate ABC transporter substrate-binding protein [Capsulimonadales bacterium]|nr:aliphatic sulfonate ABC transporter substrate-binding protein [Capsulimonadales bacterium]